MKACSAPEGGAMLRTDFDFTLPCGYLDAEGTLHRDGLMRRATAADEILPLRDPRVVKNPAYLVVILLSFFSVAGFFIQGVASATPLGPLPPYLAMTGAIAAALPATRSLSRAVAKVIPRDETNALEQTDFLGLVGTVTIGPLDQGKPGTVRVKDRHENIHFLRTQAASGHMIDTGAQVLIVDGADGLFQAIPAPPDLEIHHSGHHRG